MKLPKKPGVPGEATDPPTDLHRRLGEVGRTRREKTWRKHPETRSLVFPFETGGPMNRNNLHRRHFRPLAQKAGLPREARLYTLRHTFATLWMESNEPVKILQEISSTPA